MSLQLTESNFDLGCPECVHCWIMLMIVVANWDNKHKMCPLRTLLIHVFMFWCVSRECLTTAVEELGHMSEAAANLFILNDLFQPRDELSVP